MDKSILEVVHESAKGLYDAGIIDATTMHEFDVSCLISVKKFTAYEIRMLRLKQHVSQAVFARYFMRKYGWLLTFLLSSVLSLSFAITTVLPVGMTQAEYDRNVAILASKGLPLPNSPL